MPYHYIICPNMKISQRLKNAFTLSRGPVDQIYKTKNLLAIIIVITISASKHIKLYCPNEASKGKTRNIHICKFLVTDPGENDEV